MESRRILLVDDEPPLLRLLETFLARSGFEVDAFQRPADALARFQASPNAYALIIADVSMPDMPGDVLIGELARMNNSIPILLSSGLPVDTEQFPEHIRRRLAFLQKPFLPKMLMESVNRLLGESGGQRASEMAR